MRRLGLLAAVGAVVLASCAEPVRESRTATMQAPPAADTPSEAADDPHLLTAWLNSEEYALAVARWRTNVESAMKDFLTHAVDNGHLPSGDCPISRDGAAVSCDVLNSYTSETENVFDAGACADYLVPFGCRPLERYTEHVRQRWFQQNG